MAEKIGWLGAQMQGVENKTASIEDKLDGHIIDTRDQFSKIATQHQEIKDILLAKQVASATRHGIARWVSERFAWIIGTAIAIGMVIADWRRH